MAQVHPLSTFDSPCSAIEFYVSFLCFLSFLKWILKSCHDLFKILGTEFYSCAPEIGPASPGELQEFAF